MTKFTLTDKQLVYLGWDDVHALKSSDAELYAIVRKIRTKQQLTDGEMEIVVQEIRLAATTFGCDPDGVRTAKGLLKKISV